MDANDALRFMQVNFVDAMHGNFFTSSTESVGRMNYGVAAGRHGHRVWIEMKLSTSSYFNLSK